MTKKQVLLIILVLSFLLPAQAQKKKKKTTPAPHEEIAVVDDEDCGCELVFVDGIQTTRKGDKFGFKLADGTVIVEPQYMFVDQFIDGYCIVLRDYDRYGLIDRTGREIVPCEYNDVTHPSNGMIRVMKDGLYGFYTQEGTLAIAPQYDAASTFSEELAVATGMVDSTTRLYGYIDKRGTFVIKPQYDYANPFYNGHAIVKQYERYGMITKKNKVVVPIKYENISPMEPSGLFFVQDPMGEKFAVFGKRYQPLTDYIYDAFTSYGDGYYTFRRDGKMGFLNSKAQECLGLYDHVDGFVGGFCCVANCGKIGIIDTKGDTILPIAYDNALLSTESYHFHEGLALIEKDEKLGFINQQGTIVIPIQYDGAFYFSDGLCPVQKDGAWGYIATDGSTKIPFIFDGASPFQYHRAEVYHNNQSHKILPSGQCVKNCSLFPKF
ncbi:MAG: WG repeat-containing protein [Bacteroidales bacterium]|nr:WG repeat-containing protein [Bacteroidales bacterium]